jgi:3-dehydroquinate synthase
MPELKSKILMVNTEERYPFIVGMNLSDEMVEAVKKEGERRVAIISDSTTRTLCGDAVLGVLQKAGLQAELIHFESGEHNKNRETVAALQDALLEKQFGRDSIVIALGGGVVGDVAGFVAATYMRGIPYIQVPTTLLGMVDSSVGGKVGVDTEHGKNLIGAFHQPRAVIADLSFLSSLSKEMMINGLMEAVKEFIAYDKDALEFARQLDLERPLEKPEILQAIVYRSVEIKAHFVEIDEEENNERKILNFGHTIGHALELLSDYHMPHGFAVGYGILVESKIAELLGVLSSEDRNYIQEYLGHLDISADALKDFSANKILDATKSDKKTRGGKAHYVLLNSVGSVYIKDGRYVHSVPDEIVGRAIAELTA